MANVKADKLKLYLAKKDDEWLRSEDPAALALRKGNIHPFVQTATAGSEMMGSQTITDVLKDNNMKMTEPRGLKAGQFHVLVVIPERETRETGVFVRCSDKLFSQFPRVDSWREFSTLMPLAQCPWMYIRSSYKSIANDALSKEDPSRRKYAVVTGTPGTGKSVFIYYVMQRLIKDNKRVLFFSHDGPIYFDGFKIFECHTLPNKFDRQFWSTDLWCLVDSIDPTKIAELSHGRCSILLASTPQRDYIDDFMNLVPVPEVFYLPLWTKDELAVIVHLYPDATSVWEDRLKCLGDIPRLVLQVIQTDPQALLMSACNSCSRNDTISMVSVDSPVSPSSKSS